MPECAQCGKQLKTFQLNAISDWKGNRFCSLEHKEKFSKALKEVKKKDKEMSVKGMIKEIKCKCNQCGKVWHYLEKDLKSLKRQQASNLMVGGGMCCNPFGAYFMNKSIEQGRQADKFDKCPKCGSGDIKKKSLHYEKKT